eukprot:403353948
MINSSESLTDLNQSKDFVDYNPNYLTHQGMVIDCFHYKDCEDMYGVRTPNMYGMTDFLKDKQRYTMYTLKENPTLTDLNEALDKNIKTYFSPALKTFILNVNGIARISQKQEKIEQALKIQYKNQAQLKEYRDIDLLIKYEKKVKSKMKFEKYSVNQLDQNLLDEQIHKIKTYENPESEGVNVLELLFGKFQEYYQNLKVNFVIIYDFFIENKPQKLDHMLKIFTDPDYYMNKYSCIESLNILQGTYKTIQNRYHASRNAKQFYINTLIQKGIFNASSQYIYRQDQFNSLVTGNR